MAVAAYCSVFPFAIEGFAGVTAMDVRVLACEECEGEPELQPNTHRAPKNKSSRPEIRAARGHFIIKPPREVSCFPDCGVSSPAARKVWSERKTPLPKGRGQGLGSPSPQRQCAPPVPLQGSCLSHSVLLTLHNLTENKQPRDFIGAGQSRTGMCSRAAPGEIFAQKGRRRD